MAGRRPPRGAGEGLLRPTPRPKGVLALDDVIAVEGGIPIVVDGKIIGAIGCSGGTAAQDGVTCAAGLAALK